MASATKTPPSFINDLKSYSQWVLEVTYWSEVTDIEATKQGTVVALSLPDLDTVLKVNIRERVFNEVEPAKLKLATGLKELIEFLDKIYKEDDLTLAYDRWTEFDHFRKREELSMEEYISEYTKLYNRVKKMAIVLPEAVLAFKLLDYSRLEQSDRKLVLTAVDYTKTETLFTQMCTSLRKYFGRQTNVFRSNDPVKTEPVFHVEDVMFTAGNRFRGANRGRFQTGTRSRAQQSRGHSYVTRKFKNPIGKNGEPLRCFDCGSWNHLRQSCPEKQQYESSGNEEAAECVIVLWTEEKKEQEMFSATALNCAVLDSACSSTVCGKRWLDTYLHDLSTVDKESVISERGWRRFKFGSDVPKISREQVTIPCYIGGKRCFVKTDVVDSDIPLLLGKPSLQRAGVKMDFGTGKVSAFGVALELEHSTVGHFVIPLTKQEEVFVWFSSESSPDVLEKKAIKLHKQFGHCRSDRLIELIRNSGTKNKQLEEIIRTVSSNCEVCLKFRKTPSAPVVALPLATTFNETVVMDLKVWDLKRGIYILYLIDAATRLTRARVIFNKTKEIIIENILNMWVADGPGVPKRFLSDNGLEFANTDFQDLCEVFSIEELKTPVESPWSNGLCERNHAVVDQTLKKILEDEPNCPLQRALAWACHAKNSLQMSGGFSSFQLVYGSNPNIAVLDESRVSRSCKASPSTLILSHLKTLSRAQTAFLQADSTTRLKRALKSTVRDGEWPQKGTESFYKRNDSDRWRGPAKVIDYQGKTAILLDGGQVHKVHVNRLSKSVPARNYGSSTAVHGDEVSECPGKPVDEYDSEDEAPKSMNTSYNDSRTNSSGISCVKTLLVPPVDQPIELSISGEKKTGCLTGRAGKATGKYKNWWNFKDTAGENISIDWTGIESWRAVDQTEEADICSASKTVLEAKQLEIANFQKFGVYRRVKDENQAYVTSRWVISEKDDGRIKARLVARGFEETNDLPKDSPTIAKEALRLIMSVSVFNNWDISSFDIKSAFLQSANIGREVFLKPPVEAEDQWYLWLLLKPVYGLADACRSWYFSFKAFITSLGCESCKLDPALFTLSRNGVLTGLLAAHVDDVFWAGSEEFEKDVINTIKAKFEISGEYSEAFKYIGLQLEKTIDGLQMHQNDYIASLSSIPMPRANRNNNTLDQMEKRDLRRIVGQLLWIASISRPDISFDVMELSMSNSRPSYVEEVKRANKIVNWIQNNPCSLLFPSLDATKLYFAVFSDASHGSLVDGVSSALGFVIFLTDGVRSCPISFNPLLHFVT